MQFAGAHIIILPMIIYIFANASGAHFNPIITASFVASGRQVILHFSMLTQPLPATTRLPDMLASQSRPQNLGRHQAGQLHTIMLATML